MLCLVHGGAAHLAHILRITINWEKHMKSIMTALAGGTALLAGRARPSPSPGDIPITAIIPAW